jgi:hypothetical protein
VQLQPQVVEGAFEAFSDRRPCFGLEDVISWGESRETELKGSSLRYSICKLSVGIL